MGLGVTIFLTVEAIVFWQLGTLAKTDAARLRPILAVVPGGLPGRCGELVHILFLGPGDRGDPDRRVPGNGDRHRQSCGPAPAREQASGHPHLNSGASSDHLAAPRTSVLDVSRRISDADVHWASPQCIRRPAYRPAISPEVKDREPSDSIPNQQSRHPEKLPGCGAAATCGADSAEQLARCGIPPTQRAERAGAAARLFPADRHLCFAAHVDARAERRAERDKGVDAGRSRRICSTPTPTPSAR